MMSNCLSSAMMICDDQTIDQELILSEIEELDEEINTFNPTRYTNPTTKIYALLSKANRLRAWGLFEKIVEKKIDWTQHIIDKEVSDSKSSLPRLLVAPKWHPTALELFLKSGVSLKTEGAHNLLSQAIEYQLKALWPSPKKIELLINAGASPNGLIVNHMPLAEALECYIRPQESHALREVRLQFFKELYKLLHKTRRAKQLVKDKITFILTNPDYVDQKNQIRIPREIAVTIAELTYQYRDK